MYNRDQFEILDNDTIISCIKEFRSSGCIESRNKIILSNIRTAQYIANKFGKNHRESYEDLMHEGIIAIIDAIKNYDITSTNKFSTYCYMYINGYMLNKLNHKFNKTFSIDFETSEEFKPSDIYLVSDDKGGLENLIETENKKRLTNVLKMLDDRDRQIIEMYFGLFNKKKNQEEIGLEFNLTKQAIGQIIKRNLEILKYNMKACE